MESQNIWFGLKKKLNHKKKYYMCLEKSKIYKIKSKIMKENLKYVSWDGFRDSWMFCELCETYDNTPCICNTKK